MGDASGAGVAPGPSETTPLIAPPPPEPEASPPLKRENSATSGLSGGGKNPFYGALRRTRRVAKALTNPWPKIYTLVLCAGVGGLLFGYDSSDIAIALPFIERSFPSVESSNLLKEAIVSITTLGASFGAFFGGFFSDYYGRRSAIMASDLIFGMAALKMGVAMTPRQLIEGRAIMGVAIGLASIVGPVYIAECAPNSIRAMMVVMYAIEIGVGTSMAYVLDFGFTHTSLSWRLMLSVAAIPAVLQMVAMFHLPESPRWLAHYGRLDEAKETMASLELDPDDKETDFEELENVYNRAKWMKSPEGQAESWNVRSREVITQLLIGVGLFLMNNFSGECALVYYSIEIIGMAGFASEDAIAQAIVNIGACATAGVLIGFFMIDRVGRRRLIMVSGTGTSVSLFLLAASFAFAQSRSPTIVSPASMASVACTPPAGTVIDTCAQCLNMACSFCGLPYEGPGLPTPGTCLSRDGLLDAAHTACTSMIAPANVTSSYTLYKEGCPSGYGWLSMLALCSFQFWFQMGLGIVPAAVNAEYYPNSVRGFCNGSAVAVSWLGNFCVSSTFLSLAAALGVPRLFCINATIVGTGTLVAMFFLPETVGLSFVEIQQLFKLYGQPGAPPAWKMWDHVMALREDQGSTMSPPPPRSPAHEATALSSF